MASRFRCKLPVAQTANVFLQLCLILCVNFDASGSPRNRHQPLLIVRGGFDGRIREQNVFDALLELTVILRENKLSLVVSPKLVSRDDMRRKVGKCQ
jgi:hypothetical protein